MSEKPVNHEDEVQEQKADHKLDVMKRVYADHARVWEDFTYVYPVISRRSGGMSIGINLNVNNACNFDCMYCCVDRSVEPETKHVDLEQIKTELSALLGLVKNGKIWEHEKFKDVPKSLRRLNDIAFSGNGEPTTYNKFGEAVRMVVELKHEYEFEETKIVLITNATVLRRDAVKDALSEMMSHNGEIWAKLDAGTESYYQLVNRTRVPFEKVLGNLAETAKLYPLIVQTMLMKVMGQPMPAAEFDAYIDRLDDIKRNGGDLIGVQLYSVARDTAEEYVGPVSDEQLNEYAQKLRERIADIEVDVFYGVE